MISNAGKPEKNTLKDMFMGANFNNGNPIRLDKRQFDENRDYLWAVPQSQNQPESESSP